MALNSRLTWALREVRRWRGQGADTPLSVRPDLDSDGVGRLSSEIAGVIDARGGLAAARRRARTIGLTYGTLSPAGRHRFFQLLAEGHDRDHEIVDRAIEAVSRAETPTERRAAEDDLRESLRPGHEVLLRRLAGQEGGLAFLVALREDLLPHRHESPELSAVDAGLRHILETWFDVGLLELVRLTWDSPAALLEKLIEYQAVHAIESWDDLKRRLGPGRRCYAFAHPGMPGEPLIFVEVALTVGVPDELGPLIQTTDGDGSPTGDPASERVQVEEQADTAVFYSISNCHRGLAGVSLGDFLIKSVAEELATELSGLETFVTLSPLPGFRSWLQGLLASSDGPPADLPLANLATSGREPAADSDVWAALTQVVEGGPRDGSDPLVEGLEPVLTHLAARYVTAMRADGRAIDPVAHFHLSNGARIERLNWMANPSAVGWERGLGMMVNYRYDLRTIETNHDRYVGQGEATRAEGVEALLNPRSTDSRRRWR